MLGDSLEMSIIREAQFNNPGKTPQQTQEKSWGALVAEPSPPDLELTHLKV